MLNFTLDLGGFYLRKIDYAVPAKCPTANDYTLKLVLILAKARGELAVWDDYLNRCLLSLDSNFQKLLGLPSLKGKSKAEAEKIIKSLAFSSALRERLLSMWNIKYSNDEFENDLHDLKELVAAESKALTAPQSFFAAKKVWYRIKDSKKLQGSFLKKILEILSALRVKNIEWARRALSEALFIDPYQFALEIDPAHFTPEELADYKKNVVLAIKIMASKLPKETFVQMYVNALASLTGDEVLIKLRDDLGYRWSLVDIRNFTKDRMVGSTFPHVWFTALSGRTTQVEIDTYLDSALDVQKLSKWSWDKLWLFRVYFPAGAKLREEIYSQLVELAKTSSANFHQRLLLTQLAENSTVKRELRQEIEFYRLPTFQLKREFYRELFFSGHAPEFALYQLWSMGDIGEDGLLWFAI